MDSQVTWLPFVLLLVTNISSTFAKFSENSDYDCFVENGSYTSNGIYSDNLNTLLSSLSSNLNDTGFYSSLFGQNPNHRAYAAIALCRTNTQLDLCRTCVTRAAVEIIGSCPNKNQAILWTEFCTLRYSNEPIFGIMMPPNGSNYSVVIKRENGTRVSNPDQFNEARGLLTEDLRSQAASGGDLIKVAAGNRTVVSDFQTIFALLQCTPDISSEECDACLVAAGREISGCCRSVGSVKILTIGCSIRYEIRPFYNVTRIEEVESIPSPSTPPPTVVAPPAASQPLPSTPPEKGDDISTGVVIVIVVSIVLCLILGGFLGAFLRKKMKTKPEETIAIDISEIISIPESKQYDFGRIRVATDNFSNANELGKGGYGVVYKGKLQDGQEIAVKRLFMSSRQGDSEFKNEMSLVAKLQHRNLVKLLGFAMEGRERLLIYELVQNASLDRFIFGNIFFIRV